MKVAQLEYPVHKTYTIPYLPHAFYLGSFIAICLLSILNVILVGSDVVTTLVSDPYAIERPWWMPSFWPMNLRPRIGDDCQPVSLVDTQPLHTNSSVSLFTYIFRRANVARSDEDPTKQMRPVPYMANPLQECEVRSIIWTLDMPSRRMNFKSNIFCKLGGQKVFTFQVPENITLAMTHYRSEATDLGQDDMTDFLAYNTFSEQRGVGLTLDNGNPIFSNLPADPASANTVLAVLDGFQKDLFDVLSTESQIRQMNNVFFHSRYIVEWTAASGNLCYEWVDRTLDDPLYIGECAGLRDLNRVLRAYGTSDGAGTGYDLYPDFLAPFAVTNTNFLIALRDAIRIDLGDLEPSSNIYLNKTYFDEIIEVDPYPEDAAPILFNAEPAWRRSYDNYWTSCIPWGCTNGTWAQTLKDMQADTPIQDTGIMLPYRPTGSTASVLNISYLCPKFQRKPIASFLMSVFVSTVTMYNFLYALFGFVMPKVEAWYQRRKAAALERDFSDPEKQEILFGKKLKQDPDSPLSPDDEHGLPRIRAWGTWDEYTLRRTLRQNESNTPHKSAMRNSF